MRKKKAVTAVRMRWTRRASASYVSENVSFDKLRTRRWRKYTKNCRRTKFNVFAIFNLQPTKIKNENLTIGNCTKYALWFWVLNRLCSFCFPPCRNPEWIHRIPAAWTLNVYTHFSSSHMKYKTKNKKKMKKYKNVIEIIDGLKNIMKMKWKITIETS